VVHESAAPKDFQFGAAIGVDVLDVDAVTVAGRECELLVVVVLLVF
jgi:hypothetical protein